MSEKTVVVAASILGQAALTGKAVRKSWSCDIDGTSNETRQSFEEDVKATIQNSKYILQK